MDIGMLIFGLVLLAAYIVGTLLNLLRLSREGL